MTYKEILLKFLLAPFVARNAIFNDIFRPLSELFINLIAFLFLILASLFSPVIAFVLYFRHKIKGW
jgi:hypothetical protein